MDKNDTLILAVVSIVAIVAIILMTVNGEISGEASKKIDATPGPVTLISPSDGTFGESLTPTFIWTRSQKADYVNLYIDDESGFSTPLVFETQLGKNVKSFTLPSGVLQPGRTYYWMIEAMNSAGATNSAIYVFATS